MKIVFVHGWGLGPDFWDGLAAFFPEAEITRVDLGFRGEADLVVPDENALYVTHSFGGLWALEHCADRMSGLVAINGFLDFPAKKAVSLMKRQLDMAKFFERAGIEASVEGLDNARLLEGLEMLVSMDVRDRDYDFPIVALAGDIDPIVPLEAVRAQFGEYVQVCVGGGHALPQTHIAWCAEQIKDVIDLIN